MSGPEKSLKVLKPDSFLSIDQKARVRLLIRPETSLSGSQTSVYSDTKPRNE